MAVGAERLPELMPIAGIRLGSANAGITPGDRDDVMIMEICASASGAAVFTRNVFCAAPVVLARSRITQGSPRLLLINAGSANAGTGEQGLADARRCCAALAELAACRSDDVLPFSTGVIGDPLPANAIIAALSGAYEALDGNGWEAAAHAIMTTDTRIKGCSRQIGDAVNPIRVTGIAKGSGMIRPNMATMLAFIATDARVEKTLLQECLIRAVDQSFNRITVDGDTSTNDACCCVATGAGRKESIAERSDRAYRDLCRGITEVCCELAEAIVRDAEGATKLIDIGVQGAADTAEARRVAYEIAHSPLVKTAFFASDPNWGRILAAVGRADIEGLDIGGVNLRLNDVQIVQGGARAAQYREEAGRRAMAPAEILLRVELGRGAQSFRVQTCDLSYDYVRINAEYRT